jgi:hypothetical protein
MAKKSRRQCSGPESWTAQFRRDKFMGRVRRGGYIITWWIGDHDPRQVHIRNAKGKSLGRLDVDTLEGLGNWTPPKDLVKIIVELKEKGRL